MNFYFPGDYQKSPEYFSFNFMWNVLWRFALGCVLKNNKFLRLMFRLKPLDILVMKHLDKCVNVIPVIAKADTLTLEEREAFKQRVWNSGIL